MLHGILSTCQKLRCDIDVVSYGILILRRFLTLLHQALSYLRDEDIGTFIVRECTSDPACLVLSYVTAQGLKHTKIVNSPVCFIATYHHRAY